MKEIRVFNLVSCKHWFCFRSRKRISFRRLVSICYNRIVSLNFTSYRLLDGMFQCVFKPTHLSYNAERIFVLFGWKIFQLQHNFGCIFIRLIVILPTVAVNSHLERRGLFLNNILARTVNPRDLLSMLSLEFSQTEVIAIDDQRFFQLCQTYSRRIPSFGKWWQKFATKLE